MSYGAQLLVLSHRSGPALFLLQDGLKKLGLVLDSEDYLRALDYATLRIQPNESRTNQNGGRPEQI